MPSISNKVRFVLIGLSAAALFSSLPGCATGTENKRGEARGAAGSFRNSLAGMPGVIDQTMNSLNALTDNRSSDKSQTLPAFKRDLAAMDRDALRLADEARAATKDADAYFAQWTRETTMSAGQPGRQAVAARKDQYATALSYLENARRHYADLTDNLHDIERMYSAGGVDGASPLVRSAVEKSVQDATYVKNYIARMGEQIDTILAVK